MQIEEAIERLAEFVAGKTYPGSSIRDAFSIAIGKLKENGDTSEKASCDRAISIVFEEAR